MFPSKVERQIKASWEPKFSMQCVLVYLHWKHRQPQLRAPGKLPSSGSLFRTEEQPNTFRESSQRGQSVATLAWLYLLRSASQDECELRLLFPPRNIQRETKGSRFHYKRVDKVRVTVKRLTSVLIHPTAAE